MGLRSSDESAPAFTRKDALATRVADLYLKWRETGHESERDALEDAAEKYKREKR